MVHDQIGLCDEESHRKKNDNNNKQQIKNVVLIPLWLEINPIIIVFVTIKFFFLIIRLVVFSRCGGKNVSIALLL